MPSTAALAYMTILYELFHIDSDTPHLAGEISIMALILEDDGLYMISDVPSVISQKVSLNTARN